MVDFDGNLIEFEECGDRRTWSRAGFERMYSMDNVASIAIPTSGSILLQGPLDDWDATTNRKIFPATLIHVAVDGTFSRIYSTLAYTSSQRNVKFQRWVLRSGIEFLDCFEAGGLKFDREAALPIHPAPDALVSALLNGKSND